MSWDQIRALGGRGVTFGPHTVTHPILAQTGDAQSAHEIAESWRRLQEERVAHVPVFCYPNGSDYAFTLREVATLRRAGLAAALTTLHGYIDATSRAAGADAPYLMRRVPYPHDELDFRQITTGLDRAKILLRRAPAPQIGARPRR
jgi:peptidoglycan/xylan/chitin deacetylase (PgdA/CDA1 family)